MAEIVKLGTLYFNGVPQNVGIEYSGGAISLGNTVPDQEISWVKLKSGLLIANRCVCDYISWKQLHEEGFVFGTPVTIDGKTYLCRCLKVGVEKGEPNEWDAALDETGEDMMLWHWAEDSFWGQETEETEPSSRAVRGYTSARRRYHFAATYRYAGLGFRPVLEPLNPNSSLSGSLVGSVIEIYGPGGVSVKGSLLDFNDYDIVLRTNYPVFVDCPWLTKDGGNIIVSRENIAWLKEA